jgi:hypothetical protein
VSALQVEVTRAWEADAAAKAAFVMAELVTKTSTQEAATTWDSAVIVVKDAEDQAALAERVSRVEAKSATALPLLARRQWALSRRSPFSRVSLWRHTGLERWPRRALVACLMHWPMLSGGRKSPRGSAVSSLRSSPFYRPEALSCALTLSVLHG